jgi:hypothetical protein
LTRSHNNVYTRKVSCFNIKIQLRVMVQYQADLIIILSKCNLFSPWYSGKIAHFALKTRIYSFWIFQLNMRVLTKINRCHNHFFNVLIYKMYANFFHRCFFSGRWYISSHGTNYLFIVHNKNRYFLLSLLKFLFENSMVTLFNICMVQVNLIFAFL